VNVYTVTLKFFDEVYGIALDAEADLHCDYRTVTANPDAREEQYCERADLRVGGKDMPCEFTRAQLDKMLADELADQREQHAYELALARKAA
jgi:hypothetical protein